MWHKGEKKPGLWTLEVANFTVVVAKSTLTTFTWNLFEKVPLRRCSGPPPKKNPKTKNYLKERAMVAIGALDDQSPSNNQWYTPLVEVNQAIC